MKNYKTKFLTPYTSEGKNNIKALRHDKQQAGVYFIKSPANEIVYVGHSKNHLYKTIFHHFQSWKSTTGRERYTYNGQSHKVRVIFTTPHRAEVLEKYLILKMQPSDNFQKYESYKMSKSEIKTAETVLDTTFDISNNEENPF